MDVCYDILDEYGRPIARADGEGYKSSWARDFNGSMNSINCFRTIVDGTWCDIEIFDVVGDSLRIREDFSCLIPLPASNTLPLKLVQFLGEACFEPNEPERVLALQYGPDFITPSKTQGWMCSSGSPIHWHE